MTEARQRIGRQAETLVAQRLGSAGWRIVARNARTRYGELDIVALDGRVLVFVEVKAGREGSLFGPERPVHSVDARKQQRLRRLATAWMAERRGAGKAVMSAGAEALHYDEIRFDAVGVTYDRRGSVTAYEHLEGAF